MRKYRLSTKYRGPKSDLADYVGLSSINHYNKHQQDGVQNLNSSLNKVYIRNFYEYHHRKRPGEGKTAKQEYDKELKEESKKMRLKEIESQVSFDRTSSSSFDSTEDENLDGQTAGQANGQMNGHVNSKMNGKVNDKINDKVSDKVNGKVNGYCKSPLPNGTLQQNGTSTPHNGDLPNGTDSQLSNGLRSKLRKSTKKYGRTRADRSSKEFFDALLSNKKSSVENEYKKCVKICKELSLAKQIQAYQQETLKDNYDTLEDTYNELYHKFKFINRECKLIEKDIERLKTDYCRLVKQDLIKKNNFIKENSYIPIYDEIPSIDLDLFGDLGNYERAYDKHNCYVDYDEYQRLSKLNDNLFLNNGGSCDSLTKLKDKDDLVDENNNKIKIEINGTNERGDEFGCEKQRSDKANDDPNERKQQVDDLLYLIVSKPDCAFFSDKVNQLVQDNLWLKSKIKRLRFDISNEKRKNVVRRNGDQTNGVVEFEFSDNLDKQKPIARNTRHTINVVNTKSNQIRSPFNANLTKVTNSSTRNLSTNKPINRFGSRTCLNVFEIPTQKVEIFQMKLKMQHKELEIQVTRLKKMKELLDQKFELKKISLEESQRNEKTYLEERKQLASQVKQLKIKEQQLFKENENLIKKVHQLTEK